MSARFREIGADRAAEFVAGGYKQRHFFPHRVYHLPKCGPDGLKMAGWMCEIDDPDAMWELVLYADEQLLAEFPRELFFDDEVIWHRQQFGRPGQVATASLVLDGDTAYSVTHVSDLVQRIARRREHKTRVEKVFKGWNHMLVNAVLNFALERGARSVRFPTLTLAARHTDHSRSVDYTIFERIYDRTLSSLFSARLEGEWWTLEIGEVRDRIVVPEHRIESTATERTVAICHDIERGLGHVEIDDGFARRADRTARGDLIAMREIEADLGVRCTYCVVGSLMADVREELERDGHCVAFHSYDHHLEREDQLLRCREVDYRIKGYRAPRSRTTPELTDGNLLFHNFEWLASAPRPLGSDEPVLRSGLVRLPIGLDDFALHTGAVSYQEWEQSALTLVERSEFAAISLHDCYASTWLHRYPAFLERVGEIARLRTLDEVAARVTLDSSA